MAFLSGDRLSSLMGLGGGGASRRGEAAMGHLLQSGEVVASAFGMGYLNGKKPAAGKNHHEFVENVPTDLASGLTLHVLNILGMFGKYGEHAANLGDGCLAAYAARLGLEVATQQKTTTRVSGGFMLNSPMPRSVQTPSNFATVG